MARIKRANAAAAPANPPEEAQAVIEPDAEAEFTANDAEGQTIYDKYVILEEELNELLETNRELLCRLDIVILDNKKLSAELELTQQHLAMSDAALKKARPNATLADDVEPQDLVELVAIPPIPNMELPALEYDGKKVTGQKDGNGYYHLSVPRKYAESLLAIASGIKYALIGPDKKMAVKRYGSNGAVDVTVYKHVWTKYETGGGHWSPVVEEE